MLFGNFTWDWIYAAYPGGAAIAETIGRVYAEADLALRLPLHGGFATCRRIEELPFVARRSRRDPAETRQALGLPHDRPLALVSFGGYGAAQMDVARLADTPRYGIVMTDATPIDGHTLAAPGPTGALLPLDVTAIYARGFRYEDVVRAVNAVVTKPGYGIIAECAANDTALLYTSRGHFAEYRCARGGHAALSPHAVRQIRRRCWRGGGPKTSMRSSASRTRLSAPMSAARTSRPSGCWV